MLIIPCGLRARSEMIEQLSLIKNNSIPSNQPLRRYYSLRFLQYRGEINDLRK